MQPDVRRGPCPTCANRVPDRWGCACESVGDAGGVLPLGQGAACPIRLAPPEAASWHHLPTEPEPAAASTDSAPPTELTTRPSLRNSIQSSISASEDRSISTCRSLDRTIFKPPEESSRTILSMMAPSSCSAAARISKCWPAEEASALSPLRICHSAPYTHRENSPWSTPSELSRTPPTSRVKKLPTPIALRQIGRPVMERSAAPSNSRGCASITHDRQTFRGLRRQGRDIRIPGPRFPGGQPFFHLSTTGGPAVSLQQP